MKFREVLKRVSPYVPGKSIEEVKKKYGLEKVVKLASNENPYGPSPKAVKAFKSFDNLHIYPDPDPEDLRQKIGEYVGFDAERIVLGAGIDGVMENIFKLFVDPGDEVVIPVPSFPYYHILTRVCGARDVAVKRREDFTIDVEAVLNSVTERTKIVLICSPNNPTGNVESEEAVREIAESCEALIFVDEAYGEFSSKNLLRLAEYENVVVARTFSKAFGLANLRIGYAVVSEEVRREYLKVSTPFPLSTPAKLAAMAALDDRDHLRFVVEKTREERERVTKELLEMGVKVYPSEANFILIETSLKAAVLAEELMKRGVIIRDCSKFIGCNEHHVRVSIGRKEENNVFLEAMRDVL
ncbi:histidinol-phosphate transaminase [Archaeoglobus veneficus]|uniref:Histidinol-phosphate aminotransferase n=1 Tax=Archaeoglobus veneficus (strain DSM 11195 / SNP6) TaxID=693661 RepID=F2KP07_ARCVS|nr:histidinol-phosphate transaminase [Archaeoglobus veneficus]AEA46315.1 Histidinol-phosphate aminotransferase [Archaeoglobus veneficus SNP6]